MDKVVSALRTLGVLLGLWVILAVVGVLTGVVPLDGLGTPAARPATDEADDDDADAGAEAAAPDAGATRAEVVPDEPSDGADPSEPAAPVVAEAARWTVCASPASDPSADPSETAGEEGSPSVRPSLAVGALFGEERPQIVVGCVDGWHVIGLGVDGPARIAVLLAPAAPSAQRARLATARIGDVDGDGHQDLVLPLAFESDNGASRGGALFWVPGSPLGIREPVALAPIAAVDAALARLDATPGADLVAMNRTNALAQLPSEAWVFSGGPAPRRREALQTALDGSAVRLGDVDRDGHADVVALSRGRVDLHFGDGAAAFPRTHTFALESAREIALGDLDGDGGEDLAVLGEGLTWIHGGPISGMEPRTIEGASASFRELALVDVNGDGKLDVVAWDHPRLAVLRQEGELGFVAEAGLTLVGEAFGPRRHRVADLDLDGTADDVVLLGSTGEGAPLELILHHDAFGGAELQPAEAPRDLPDAPLVLRATLAP